MEIFKVYIDLFMAFLRASNFSFGGGPGAISLIQKEVVETYHWMNMSEFTDAVALSNSLPGPIATKLATVIGYKVAGWLGVVITLMASVLPTTILIVILYKVYDQFKDAPWMNGMMTAVKPVVVLIIFETVYKMAPTSFQGLTTVAIGIVSAVLLFYFKVSPIYLIVGAFVFGAIFVR